jgi:MTH538 TIR-like domain (DUF1863)
MPPQETNGAMTRFFSSEFFVSHTLVDTDYFRLLVLPAIEAVVSRRFNQYVFMNLQNFGKSSLADDKNAALFAEAYSREIDRLLRDSRFMLVVASHAATQSAWVRYEVGWWMRNRAADEMMILFKESCEAERLHSAARQCESLRLVNLPEAAAAVRLRSVLRKLRSHPLEKGGP